jgi:hypothetical protein
MPRSVTEDLDGVTVTAWYNQHQKDYLVYTSLTGPESVAWVKRKPEMPQSRQWGVAWLSGLTTWYPTLGSALHHIGKRVLAEQWV